jgi:hypothetical protein
VKRSQLRWLEGQIHQGQGDPASAERVWREALSGFDELGDLNAVAERGLELALLYHQEGRFDEVLDLVTTRVAPALEALGIHREHVAALELLQEAMAAKELSEAVLRKAHGVVQGSKGPGDSEWKRCQRSMTTMEGDGR